MLLFLVLWSGRHFSPSRSGLSCGRGVPRRMTEIMQGLRLAALEVLLIISGIRPLFSVARPISLAEKK